MTVCNVLPDDVSEAITVSASFSSRLNVTLIPTVPALPFKNTLILRVNSYLKDN
jgi:hypothetical protein